MAKHIPHGSNGKGKISLGKRRSSINAGKPIKVLAAITNKAVDAGLKTNMRLAFEGAKLLNLKSPVRNSIVSAFKNKAGIKRPGKGYSIKASFRTRNALQAMGVVL